MVRAMTSASARGESSPMMSAFHWRNSRNRPRWGRSARKKLGMQNHFVGLGRDCAAAPYMREAAKKEMENGKPEPRCIINVSSTSGLHGNVGQANYAASKGGEIALTKSLARELGKFNVNVNAVCPGLILTDMALNMPPEARNRSQGETALGRLGTPEECADLVAFLCSDRARHITGEVVKVDGGQYM